MAKAYSTINTKLWVQEGTGSTATWVQLPKIKSYPDLGAVPEKIATTDLEDTMETSVLGVQSIESMDFILNYTLEGYETLKALEGETHKFKLTFGEESQATWDGESSVCVNGGEVNAVREMTLSIAPSTKPVVEEYDA